MSQTTPAFIVQSLDQARTALMATRAFSCAPLILSTPGYAAVMGAAVFQTMIDALRRETPDFLFTSAVDCGHEPGHALAAFRVGVEGVVIGGNTVALNRIKDMAGQINCMVYSPEIYEGYVLDMNSELDMATTCHGFLTDWHVRNSS